MLFEFVGNTSAQTSAGPTQFELAGNFVYRPGSNATFNKYEATGSPPAPSGLALGLGLSNQNTAGFTNLITLYQAARVYGSRIEVTVTPISSPVLTGVARLVVTPFPITAAAVVRLTPETALVQPFGKEALITNANYSKMNTVSHSMFTHTVFGVSPQAVRDEDSFSTLEGVNIPVNAWGWAIWYEPMDGANAQYAISVKVFYDIEWFNKNLVKEN